MQKKPQKTLHLTELISQPQCLKLLILHTPFLLDLGSLHLCVNLVKLDLSKNNLQVFPYLGDLPNLKFMFLHQNKLDVDGLVGIFQKGVLGHGEEDEDENENEVDGQEEHERGMISRGRSVLSRSIIWVTYWGNKGEFSARHYLINRTSVIAVDHWMVVPEEKSQAIMAGIKEVQRYRGKTVQPFSDITDIREILQNRRKFNKNASQQEYMEQFWQDIAQIRKKYVQINPIIKIQKVFRGWSYRIKQIRKQLQISQKKSSLFQSFKSWLFFTKNSKKLRLILQKRKKTYLLLPPSQMKIEHLKQKIRLFAQQCKHKVLLRKMNLRCQYKFFNALKSNQQSLHSLYNILHINIQDSKYLMIHIEGIEQWRLRVLPVVRGMNESKGVEIVEEANRDVQLRYLYQSGRKRREFLRLMEINEKSFVYIGRVEGGDGDNGKTGRTGKSYKEGSQSQRSKYGNNALLKCPPKLSKIYSLNNVHFSNKQDQTMKKIQKSFNTKLTLNLSQLRKVSIRSSSPQLSTQILRDLVRMSYFFNMGYLTNCQPPPQKINFLSEYSIKRMTAILRIQKMWRGRSIRRKLKQIINKNFIRQRAAIRIQRWMRNLGWRHRQVWMIQQIREMRAIEGESFYVDMEEYMGIVGQPWGMDAHGGQNQKRMMFLQQNIRPYINQKNARLLLSWDIQSHNQSAFINYRQGKKLFTNHFNQLVFGSPPNLQPIITYPQQPHYQKCQISHLFHYQTQISILTLPFSLPVLSNSNPNINSKNKKYTKLLQVKCHNKYQCRLRILALRLHTYKFNKKFQGLRVYTKETLGLSSIGREMKKVIKNNNSIFLGQESSMFQIQPVQSSIAKIFNYQSKFYITLQNNQKPIKFTSNLKIILISSQLEQSKHYNLIPTLQSQTQNQAQLNPNSYAHSNPNKNDKKIRSMSYNQHFDISNFLISDTSDIKLQANKNQRQSSNANEPISDIKPYMGKKYIKQSLKNIQYYKKQKYRNRQRVHTEFYEQLPNNMVIPAASALHGNGNGNSNKNKFNFMLGDPSPLPYANPNPNLNKVRNDRLTTQPDLTHERSLGSMGSIFGENQNQNNANVQGNLRNVGSSNSRLQSIVRPHSLHQSQKKQIQSRILARKSMITNQQAKTTSKNLDTFTKNFINQGNFIQNQFLYGQIKRLKTGAQQNSYSQANRIKTEQNETQKNLQAFQEDKIKRAQNMHQRHKEELFRSMIEKRLEIQAREKEKNKEKQKEREKDKKRKSDGKQGYRSLPRKMRINFAQECYPILGKYGPQESKIQQKKGN